MNVLVTGASGFIGQHVARTLAGRGMSVVATGRTPSALAPLAATGARIVTANLATDSLDGLLRGCDAVVHCAAMAAPWGAKEAFVRDNVRATERLLHAAFEAGVRRFVHLSSPSIYAGFTDQLDVSEAFTPPKRWTSIYGETKWVSEQCVLQPRFASLEPVVLRPRAVFGEGDRAIVPRVLAVARRGRFPLIRGGRAMIDVTYVGNVVSAVERALETPRENTGRAYNITNGEPMTVRRLLDRLFNSLDLRVRYVPLPAPIALAVARLSEAIANLRANGVEPRLTRYGIALLTYSLTLDISAARERLGYQPMISVEEGLNRYAAWWRQHGAA
jgi:nucleoside-diphosphate-sugar epimerase